MLSGFGLGHISNLVLIFAALALVLLMDGMYLCQLQMGGIANLIHRQVHDRILLMRQVLSTGFYVAWL